MAPRKPQTPAKDKVPRPTPRPKSGNVIPSKPTGTGEQVAERADPPEPQLESSDDSGDEYAPDKEEEEDEEEEDDPENETVDVDDLKEFQQKSSGVIDPDDVDSDLEFEEGARQRRLKQLKVRPMFLYSILIEQHRLVVGRR